MLITLQNGKAVRGDLIVSSVVRSDLAPIPVTIEAEIRADDDMKKQLAEGSAVTVNGDVMRIVKSVPGNARVIQGEHGMETVKIIGFLDSCRPAAFVRQTAIIKEKTTMSAIYKAAGAALKAVDNDISVPYFCCLVGDTPTFQITKVLQEQGCVMRWKGGKLSFIRTQDLFSQKIRMTVPGNSGDDLDSGFLERHEIPFFYSIADDGSFVYGNRSKARTGYYVPNKNAQQLVNMSRCLIRKKTQRIALNLDLIAGDLIGIIGGQPLVIMTAAHVFRSGSDGSPADQYTRLWLGELNA